LQNKTKQKRTNAKKKSVAVDYLIQSRLKQTKSHTFVFISFENFVLVFFAAVVAEID